MRRAPLLPLVGLLLVGCGGGGSDEPCRQPLSPTAYAGYVGSYAATFRTPDGAARAFAFAFAVAENGSVAGEDATEGEVRGIVGRHFLCAGNRVRTEVSLYFSHDGAYARIDAAAKPTPTLDGDYPATRTSAEGTEKGTLTIARSEAR